MLTRILLAGLLASTMMFAQRGGGGGGRGGGGMNMGGGGFSAGTRLDRMSEALKLTKDQKKDVKEVMDEAQKEASPIHEQITKSHLAIGEAVAAGKPKEEIDKAVRSEAELETQLASHRITCLRQGSGVRSKWNRNSAAYRWYLPWCAARSTARTGTPINRRATGSKPQHRLADREVAQHFFHRRIGFSLFHSARYSGLSSATPAKTRLGWRTGHSLSYITSGGLGHFFLSAMKGAMNSIAFAMPRPSGRRHVHRLSSVVVSVCTRIAIASRLNSE